MCGKIVRMDKHATIIATVVKDHVEVQVLAVQNLRMEAIMEEKIQIVNQDAAMKARFGTNVR